MQPYNRLELSVRQPALKSILAQQDEIIAMRTQANKTNTLQEKEKRGFLNKTSRRFSPEGFIERDSVAAAQDADPKTKTSRLFNITGGKLGQPLKTISPLARPKPKKRERSYGFATTTHKLFPQHPTQ